jgi:hypothetical protein
MTGESDREGGGIGREGRGRERRVSQRSRVVAHEECAAYRTFTITLLTLLVLPTESECQPGGGALNNSWLQIADPLRAVYTAQPFEAK